MFRNTLLIGLGTVVFTLLGIALYQLQGPIDNPAMNFWGILSFGALGTSLGCLVVEPPTTSSFFDSWF